MASLKLPDGLFGDLRAHLLPRQSMREEAAFLFAQPVGDTSNFEVIGAKMLKPGDFAHHQSDYLELDDSTRASLIKQAHDRDASLVELHSHPGPFPAAFSYADLRGLQETVPYMWWRLKKRPYFAIVVAEGGFDALAWIIDPSAPEPLTLEADGQVHQPTNNTLSGML